MGVFATYATTVFFSGLGLLAFYAFNFVPDVPALGWMMVGIYGLYQYEKAKRWVVLMALQRLRLQDC
ncbi:MAG: hypothetical protein R2769_05595 [Saprospiraceae bacterium]